MLCQLKFGVDIKHKLVVVVVSSDYKFFAQRVYRECEFGFICVGVSYYVMLQYCRDVLTFGFDFTSYLMDMRGKVIVKNLKELVYSIVAI